MGWIRKSDIDEELPILPQIVSNDGFDPAEPTEEPARVELNELTDKSL